MTDPEQRPPPVEINGYHRHTTNNHEHRYIRKMQGWWLLMLMTWDALVWRRS